MAKPKLGRVYEDRLLHMQGVGHQFSRHLTGCDRLLITTTNGGDLGIGAVHDADITRFKLLLASKGEHPHDSVKTKIKLGEIYRNVVARVRVRHTT